MHMAAMRTYQISADAQSSDVGLCELEELMEGAVSDNLVPVWPESAEVEVVEARTADNAVVIHMKALTGFLNELVAAMWSRSMSSGPAAKEQDLDQRDLELTDEDRRILTLLGAGLKDASIARRLQIGTRTVQRRVRRLMDLAGVDTRFQIGLEAARRGWL